MTGRSSRIGAVPPWHAWTVCLLGAGYFGYGYCLRVAPSVMFDELMRDFGVTALALGNLSAAYYYAFALLQVPVGLAVDRSGPARIMTLSATVCVAGAFLFAFSPDLGSALVGRTLIGAGAATAWVATLKLGTIWLPHWRYGLLAGLTNLIGMLGATLGQAPTALMVDGLGWRMASHVLGGAGMVMVALLWWAGRARVPADASPGSAAAGRPGFAAVLALVARHPATWLLPIYNALVLGPLLAFGTLFAVPFAVTAYGIDRTTAGGLASAVLLGWGVGPPIWGWLSDRTGRRKPVLFAAPVGVAAIWTVLLLAGDPPVAVVATLFFLSGFAAGAAIVGFAWMREASPPEATGTTAGLINASVMVAISAAQVFFGYWLDLNWDGGMADGVRQYGAAAYVGALTAIPVGALAAILPLALIPERRPRPAVP